VTGTGCVEHMSCKSHVHIITVMMHVLLGEGGGSNVGGCNQVIQL
jgi:hypothetical protein